MGNIFQYFLSDLALTGDNDLQMMTRKTLRAKIDAKYKSEKEKMIGIFKTTKEACVTVDIWSTKLQSYLGVG